MKYFKYIMIAFTFGLFASCMEGSYDAPDMAQPPYGNNALTESNVLTIQELKDKYNSVISTSSMTEVTEDIQIKAIVTGNDISGNLYNQFAVQDSTGALLVSVTQGGLYGYLPVGQEILISLKGLIIGGYGKQTQIGGIYTNATTGAQSVGRMNRYVWDSHYKLLKTNKPETVLPTLFDVTKISNQQYLTDHCGKLMTIKKVKLSEANGKAVFAPSNDPSVVLLANAANRSITGFSSSKIVLRTSTFADFANDIMPTTDLDITGIFTRYNNTWQILLRTSSDIQPSQK